METAVVLPRLDYPFEAAVSPYAEEVDERTFQWGSTDGIFDRSGGGAERYRGTRVGWLAGRTSPRSSPAGLQLLADWQTWLFAFDDSFCDESATGERPEVLIQAMTRYLGVIEEPGKD